MYIYPESLRNYPKASPIPISKLVYKKNTIYKNQFVNVSWSRVCTEHLLRSAGPAPARRYGHVMLRHARHLYVFGGAADSTLPSDLHCYDLDTQMWSVFLICLWVSGLQVVLIPNFATLLGLLFFKDLTTNV